MSSDTSKKYEFSGGARVLGFLFGLYLIVGAAMTANNGKLFIGFPPQLDIVSFLLGDSTTGAYIEAAIAAALGLLLVGVAIAGSKENAP